MVVNNLYKLKGKLTQVTKNMLIVSRLTACYNINAFQIYKEYWNGLKLFVISI